MNPSPAPASAGRLFCTWSPPRSYESELEDLVVGAGFEFDRGFLGDE
jgi:hypothetical protein